MKKSTREARERIVKRNISLRTAKVSARNRNNRRFKRLVRDQQKKSNRWLDEMVEEGTLNAVKKGLRVTLVLPTVMNLSSNYEITAAYFLAIRRLSKCVGRGYRGGYRLAEVNFDNLQRISTSAALVLTAELSRWDDSIRNHLRPKVERWDKEILQRFFDLGYFDLFRRRPDLSDLKSRRGGVRIVKYIKGSVFEQDFRRLKEGMRDAVGKDIQKWTFLHSGLDEAITNVAHHAYPDIGVADYQHKNWYLTGAYDPVARELKVIFYDQGIGIPRSLPESHIKEKVLNYFSEMGFSAAERRRDEVLLKAAMEVSRTRTGQNDRGKGLQDVQEFIKQRNQGYLSILSGLGLYKFSIDAGRASVKTHSFNSPIDGTLIIWKVNI